jgi:iron complex outermembrane receptor protein
MKSFSIIFIFTFLSFQSIAQFDIQGTVTDKKGRIIEYAQVFLEGTNYITETNDEGYYKLTGVEFGSYNLKVTLLGYNDFEQQIYVDKNQYIDIVLEEKTYKLKEIQIYALRASEKMPFAYKNIGKEKIQNSNYGEDIPYLLQYTPSVVSTSDAGAGIGYSGIRIRGTDPTRINVTINGIPLNDAESQQVYWVDLPDIAGSSENIQIQRGVGTSTNGAGAFGATININTDKIRVKPHISIEGSYGSYNTSKISAKAGTGLMNGKYSIDARYTSIKSDGYIDRASSALNSFFFTGTRLFENSSLKFNAIIGKEKTYQAWYGVPVQYISNDSLRTFNLAGTDYFSKNPPYDNQIDDYGQNHFQLFYNTKLGEKSLLNLAFHYTKGSGFYEQYKTNENLIDYNLDTFLYKTSDIIRQKWLSNHFYGLVYSFKKEFENSEIIIGGAANKYDGDHFGRVVAIIKNPNYDRSHIYYKNTGKKNDVNFYSKYLFSFSENLNSYLDLQYRYVSYNILGNDDEAKYLDYNDNFNFFNPKLGLKYTNKGFSAYSSFAIGHKEPNRVDYINSAGQLPKPENLYDLEAGVNIKHSHFAAGINAYNMSYTDQLVLTGKLDDVGNPIRENVSNSYRRGLELEFSVIPVEFLTLEFNTTVSKNKIKKYTEYISNWDPPYKPVAVNHENTDISFSPSLIAGGSISFDLINIFSKNEDRHLYLKAFQKYVSKQYIDNTMNENAKLDSYGFTNFSLEYVMKNNIFNKLQISFVLNNAFNKKYVTNGWVSRIKSKGYNPVPDDPYTMRDSGDIYQYMGLYPQALRNFMFRMKFDF